MRAPILRQQIAPLLLALVIGALAGMGAVVFRALIGFGQELLWPGGIDFATRVQAASWWWKILVPTAMGLAAGPILAFWAPEVSGPGVPEVMEALALRGGRIRHRVTLIKTFVTAALISAGGSLGREGPIVQIGSSIGSSISQLFRLGRANQRLAVACGAAAGIAATFQAPMAGAMFAVEILLFDLEVASLSHIVVASVTGTLVARPFMGTMPVFQVPTFTIGPYGEIFIYLVLGLAAGLASLLLIGAIVLLPRLWQALRVPMWIRPGLGGLLVGLMAFVAPWALGVGYESINLVLANKLSLALVLFLLTAKILATGMSIGSGMSGGIFAPSLVVGAMLGWAVGAVAHALWPGMPIEPAHYALVGMGAVVSGMTLAPITAILTIFELTYSYPIILPLMVSCIASLAVVRLLYGHSVYEAKLLAKGVHIVRGHAVNILRGMRVGDHMDQNLQILRHDAPCESVAAAMEKSPFPHFVVLGADDRLEGVLTLLDFRGYLAHPKAAPAPCTASTFMSRNVVTVTEDTDMETAFHLFAHHDFSFLPVVQADAPDRVIGQLKKTELFAAYDQNVFKDHLLPKSKDSNPSP